MANFYTESDEPLKKVSSLSYRNPILTSPALAQRRHQQPSPLSLITKFVLGELEKPSYAKQRTCARIKECKTVLEKEHFVRRELFRMIDSNNP